MAESIREQLIRLGVITPASESSPAAAPTAPQQPVKKVTSGPPPNPWRKGRKKRAAESQPQGFRLANHLQSRPGTAAWKADLKQIENFLLTASQEEFREVVSSKKFEEVINIHEFVRSVCSSPAETTSWLIEMAWQFSDLGSGATARTEDIWVDYHRAKARYQYALLVWEVSRNKLRPDEYYEKVVRENAGSDVYRSWMDAVHPNCSPTEQRKAEVRVAFAAYVVQNKKSVLGVTPAYEQPAKSVWEAGGSTRRFGGGRPRSERFKR